MVPVFYGASASAVILCWVTMQGGNGARAIFKSGVPRVGSRARPRRSCTCSFHGRRRGHSCSSAYRRPCPPYPILLLDLLLSTVRKPPFRKSEVSSSIPRAVNRTSFVRRRIEYHRHHHPSNSAAAVGRWRIWLRGIKGEGGITFSAVVMYRHCCLHAYRC